VVNFTPRTLHSKGKGSWYPLNRRMGEPQIRSGRSGEENSQPLPRLEPPIIQPVAQRYTTELSRYAHNFYIQIYLSIFVLYCLVCVFLVQQNVVYIDSEVNGEFRM
jgi:hypothetical protein